MSTIKNIGTKCNSREQARNLAKSVANGRVVDLMKYRKSFVESQMIDQSAGLSPLNTRWIVLHDKKLSLKNRGGFMNGILNSYSLYGKNDKLVFITSKRGAMAYHASLTRKVV